jgi:hypothetical protein
MADEGMVAGEDDLPAAGDVEMADAPDIAGQRDVVFDLQGESSLFSGGLTPHRKTGLQNRKIRPQKTGNPTRTDRKTRPRNRKVAPATPPTATRLRGAAAAIAAAWPTVPPSGCGPLSRRRPEFESRVHAPPHAIGDRPPVDPSI